MALPNKLGISFTTAEMNAMMAGIKAVTDGIRIKMVLNIDKDTRRKLSKVNDGREPYVLKSVKDFAVNFPVFNPIAYPLSDAEKNLDTRNKMTELRYALENALEIVKEMEMVAGHEAFAFMRQQYKAAQHNLSTNITGAQTVVDGLKGAFRVTKAEHSVADKE
jgi:hypothetical protein